ncbi:MAG: phospholipase [Gammaproteobacteria bacterium]|jgi:hypothetical protein|nr:phospholipase [Gammaproteobacteria bacterium]
MSRRRRPPCPSPRAPALAALLLLAGCATSRPCPHPGAVAAADPPPAACRVDGCTLAPDLDFQDCCDAHDEAYWAGGTRAARLSEDRRLRACLATRGHGVLAPLYYAGVRIGGSPSLPTPWRWGFGWPFGRGYIAEEKE